MKDVYVTEACIAQRMYALGYKRKAIAEVLCCSMSKVDNLIPEHNRQRVYKLPFINHICWLRHEYGQSLESIARVHGMPVSSVDSLCKAHKHTYKQYSTYHCEECNHG